MKANILTPKVKAERKRENLYQACYKDIGTQCLAMCLYTLDKAEIERLLTEGGWEDL